MNAKLKKFLIAAAAVLAAALLFLAGYFTYYLTMSGGLRSLLWVKDMVQDEYYEEVSDDEFWQAAIDGVMDSLDVYSAYYTADEYDAVIDSDRGIRSGIGASFFSGTNKVYRIALNSPLFFAAEGGVEAGMYLTGVGESESSFTLTDTYAKVSAALSSASGKVVLRFSSVSASDTENCVYVAVEPAVYTESHVLYASGGKAYAYLLAGEEYVWTDVSAYVTVEEKVPEGAAYIQLTQFEGNAGNEFAEAARQYKEDGAKTLLFDLRNNGGGRLSVMQQIARYLCKDASAGSTVLEARYRSGKKELYTIDASLCETYFAGSRIYAAGNGNTASASEALLGAMISYGTLGYGDIFVTQTAGEDSRAYLRQGHHADHLPQRRHGRGDQADHRGDLLAERRIHPRQGHHRGRRRRGGAGSQLRRIRRPRTLRHLLPHRLNVYSPPKYAASLPVTSSPAKRTGASPSPKAPPCAGLSCCRPPSFPAPKRGESAPAPFPPASAAMMGRRLSASCKRGTSVRSAPSASSTFLPRLVPPQRVLEQLFSLFAQRFPPLEGEQEQGDDPFHKRPPFRAKSLPPAYI